MALIDRIRERSGSDLSDGELQAMIDAAVAEIEARHGPAGAITTMIGDPHEDRRWRQTLSVLRPIDVGQPVELVEIEPARYGGASGETTLDPADYRVFPGGRILQRLTGGPNGNSQWAPLVRATYTPIGDQAARDEVAIKLVQIDLSYRGGLKSERAGDYSFTLGADPAQEREKLLASLGRQGFVMA
ncbi:MAG: hypothetical protein ABJG86_09750 [Nitratireductor sp.]